MIADRRRSFRMRNQDTEPTIEARLKERLSPEGPVVMYQRWSELLFLHWAVPPEVVQAGLPEGLAVDTFEGRAWIGVVPFLMGGVRPRGLPAVAGLSSFPELNLRTYVYDRAGRPGVWFYSLDTPNGVANWIARKFFHLNYRTARMKVSCGKDGVDYRAELKLPGRHDAPQRYRWRREGPVSAARPGSLEFFLVERYRLFAYDWKHGRLFSGRVHHEPYPIQHPIVHQSSDRLFGLNRLEAPTGAPDSVLCSAGVKVTVHPLARISG
jgi:uncharacterized protein YqjF (DUF2071 family)